jgi:hypothetical protein
MMVKTGFERSYMKQLVLIFLVVLIGACGQEQPVEQDALPPGHPPMQDLRSSPPGAAAQTTLGYEFPDSWQRQMPANPMRLDQAVIPGSAGQGELIVFFFGSGTGGSAEANLQRWIDQMESNQSPVRESFETGELSVRLVDISGTLLPSTMGSGPDQPVPNSRMFAAVVEGEGGPWFFKATGPEATMAENRGAFVGMLRNLELRGSRN